MTHPSQCDGVVIMRGTDEASGSLFSYVDLDRPSNRRSCARGKLDAIIQANTAMLLQAIAAHYDPPLTAAELPSISVARAETITLWEDRIEVIWAEWHSHLQRLRPIREAM